MDEKKHNLVLEDRKKLSVSACEEVVSFNENEIVLCAQESTLVIKGVNLKVCEVSRGTGEALLTGDSIDSLVYTKGSRRKKESILGRMLK